MNLDYTLWGAEHPVSNDSLAGTPCTLPACYRRRGARVVVPGPSDTCPQRTAST